MLPGPGDVRELEPETRRGLDESMGDSVPRIVKAGNNFVKLKSFWGLCYKTVSTVITVKDVSMI